MRIAVVGGAGYVGGELLRLLLQHAEVRSCVSTSRSQAGKPIAAVHPGLCLLTEARFSGAAAAEVARDADVVFLALEHGQSSELMAEVVDAGPGLIVDLAADFRIRDGRLYQQYYGAHPAPALVHRFRYALADVLGPALRGAQALAVPGCFATAAQLALYPLAGVRLAAPPAVFAVTGSSGAGAHPKPTTHHPMRAHNLFAYAVLGHRHEGEILEQWRRWTDDAGASARLLTHSGPFVRGIYATLHASVLEPLDSEAIGARYARAYAGRPFVQLLEQPPELTHAVGTNLALLYATSSSDGREVQVMLALDNLVKGAGGQAVQAMNLALGLEETAGLTQAAVYPI
jgi:N-acetyl-gamma-glutamyl-phosphate/LysW-gamma-L-alpha-aminoadipyl-6-phosphate reductase